MQILTLNIWGTRGPLDRRQILIDAIRALNPDILCLQEATDEKLLSTLSYPTCLQAPIGGLAILSRFPAKTNRVETYRTASALEPYRRQVLLAELDIGDGSLWAVTTHLAWQAADEPTRISQVEELLKLVEPLPDHLLLSGDFNAEPASPPIQRIVSSGFQDLFTTLHPQEPGITWDNRNPFIQSHTVKFPDRRIDYLFLRKKALEWARLDDCRVVCGSPNPEGLFPSDHYGVLARLSVKGSDPFRAKGV